MKRKCKLCDGNGVLEITGKNLMGMSFEPCECIMKEVKKVFVRKMAFNVKDMRDKKPLRLK